AGTHGQHKAAEAHRPGGQGWASVNPSGRPPQTPPVSGITGPLQANVPGAPVADDGERRKLCLAARRHAVTAVADDDRRDTLSDSTDAARIDQRRDVAMRVDVDKAGADDLTAAVDRRAIDRCEIAQCDDSSTADTDVHLPPGRAAAVDHLAAAQNHVHCEIGPPPVRMYTVDSSHEAPERVREGSR